MERDFIEVDHGYYFINYSLVEMPNHMVVIVANDRCVVNKNGVELFGKGAIAVSKQIFA